MILCVSFSSEKMGVEVLHFGGFEVVPAPFEDTNGKMDQGKGDKVSIKFGSLGEPPKKAHENNKNKNNNVLISDVPKDAAEEWPAAKQIHSFYFVKHRHFDDPKIKAKLDLAEKELEKFNKARAAVFDQLKAKWVRNGLYVALTFLVILNDVEDSF